VRSGKAAFTWPATRGFRSFRSSSAMRAKSCGATPKVAQEGTLEVVVHEPVPTADWSKADLDGWVPRMRRGYMFDTLDDWPGIDAGKKWFGGNR